MGFSKGFISYLAEFSQSSPISEILISLDYIFDSRFVSFSGIVCPVIFTYLFCLLHH